MTTVTGSATQQRAGETGKEAGVPEREQNKTEDNCVIEAEKTKCERQKESTGDIQEE